MAELRSHLQGKRLTWLTSQVGGHTYENSAIGPRDVRTTSSIRAEDLMFIHFCSL